MCMADMVGMVRLATLQLINVNIPAFVAVDVAIVVGISGKVRIATLRRIVPLMLRPANTVTLLGVVSGGSIERLESPWTVGGRDASSERPSIVHTVLFLCYSLMHVLSTDSECLRR
jgi:hypothetical protein